MRILWIATKPPRPSRDGGRLVMAATLDALAAAGADVTCVAPDEPPHAWWRAALRAARSGRPVSVERHTIPSVAARVADLLHRTPFDIVHIEQPQALPGAEPARRAGLPCVLRAQNVESDLWTAAATIAATSATPASRLRARLLRLEARRGARFEAAALGMVDATIALSAADANRLSALNGAARVVVIPPPASGDRVDAPPRILGGDPPFVWIGSAGWPPNDAARHWLIADVWPAIAARLPAGRLHLFGGAAADSRGTDSRDTNPQGADSQRAHRRSGDSRGADRHDASRHDLGQHDADARVVRHAGPADSADAFAAGAILLLPLRTAAGVRMRILEAWTRGVPVIASPAAAEGLDVVDGRDALLASDPHGFANAAARLAGNATLRTSLVEGGRATLARRHDPAAIAEATIAVYREAIEHRRRMSSRSAVRAST